jgi:hypothetical protein
MSRVIAVKSFDVGAKRRMIEALGYDFDVLALKTEISLSDSLREKHKSLNSLNPQKEP